MAAEELFEDPTTADAPDELLVDSLLLSLIRAQPGQKQSELARLKNVTQAIFGRDPVICTVPGDLETKAVKHMVELLHSDAVKASISQGKYKRLSISKAAAASQELYFPSSTHPHNTRKRLQDLYSGSHLNKNPDRVGEGGRANPQTHKKGLLYEHMLEDRVTESMVHQQLLKIEAILKPWGTPMKVE